MTVSSPSPQRAPLKRLILSLLLSSSLGVGCDSAGSGASEVGGSEAGLSAGVEAEVRLPTARFELAAEPSQTPLARVPFPHDLYRAGDRVKLSGAFPGAWGILAKIITALEANTDGFGTTSSLYASFEEQIDLSSLPQDGGASLRDDSALSLVDIDPSSPEYGRRWPVRWSYLEREQTFTPAHTLAVRVLDGLALRPRNTYALIISDEVASPSDTMSALLAAETPSEGALAELWASYEPVRAWLGERGASAPGVALASVFTTQDPVSELFTLREAIQALPAPEPRLIESVGVQRAPTNYELYRGRYSAPRFQEGDIPYKAAGGAIRFDEAGAPIVQGEEDLRFSLAVPADDELPMPEEGWPVVLYAHGTGGNYESYVRGDVGLALAGQGVAVLSIDQIHHGERDGGVCGGPVDYVQCVSLNFFNVLVPEAGRDNVRQSALDYVSLTRLVPNINIPAETSAEGRAVKLNPNKVMFMGHSQGGLNGPLFLAIEPNVLGAVFSGAGSNIAISLEQKTKPFDLNRIVSAALNLPQGEALDRWHPALMLLQTFLEPGDSSNYGRYWFVEPAEGHRPKSVMMTVGLEDDFTPPESTFALAASGQVPIVEPVLTPIEALDFLGVTSPGLPPFSANVANGQATAGLAQFEGMGHYVIFESSSARNRYARFLADLANRSVPKIY